MNKISCIVVDDEPLARKLLESYVDKIPHLALHGSFGDAQTAGSFLRSNPVDLMLLDIQMPGLTGLQFVQSMDRPPSVIFTTAHRNFGPEAFEVKALDYLLKPISFERFLKAVNRWSLPTVSKAVIDDGYLTVPSNRSTFRIRFSDIKLVESMDDQVLIHTRDRTLMTRKPISKIMEELPSRQFVRIHRAFIVSVIHVGKIGATSVELEGRLIPVGRMYKREALAALGVA